ncbi:MAG: EAL domain-containing protein, partial [Bacteroidota bacterium]
LLRAITAPDGGTFEERVQRALALTTALLEYDIGILSRIQDERYIVIACHAPGVALQPGAHFSLESTYCSLMLATGELLSIEHMGQSADRYHPCYEAFELESYAGIPVYRNGEIWGTLNVSSPTPRPTPLPEADGEFLRVLATWIGGELERQDLLRSLTEQEIQLNAVLKQAPMILYAFDVERTVTLSTGGGLAALGLEDGQTVGMNLRDFNEPGSPADVSTRNALSGTASSWQAEYQGRMYETSAEPIFGNDGTVIGGIAVSMDVTSRAEAEAAQQESELRYRMLSNATSEGIAFSRNGVIFDCNHQLARLFGYPDRADAIGTDPSQVVAPEYAEQVREIMIQNRPEPYEVVCIRPDGTRFWAEIKGHPIDYNGETVRMTAVRDITPQKDAEAQTRFHADVLRHVSDAVIALDLEGRVTYWNVGAERIHGFDADRMLGRRLDEVVRYKIDEDSYRPPALESTLEAMFRESDTFGHLIYTTPHGIRRYVSVASSVLRDEEGDARGMLAVVRDVTDQHEMAVQLQHQAYHDALTGLPNRAWFHAKIKQALDHGDPFAVLFIDLDHFKVVNDSLGHNAGDQLLKSISTRLRETLGASVGAVVSRLGGDEFGVLLPGDAAHAETAAVALLQTLDAPVNLGPRTLAPEGSVGVVTMASQYDDPDALLRDADTAMYVAKRSGRNQICIFDEAMHEAAKERFQLEHDLRLAVERDQLRLRFQPIIHLETGTLAGVEALVRWEHPTQGLISPGVFVPLAEEVNLIPTIDRWVLQATCAEVGTWPIAPDSFLVSVNCSDQTLLSNGLSAFAYDAITSANLPASVLALELTERALIDSTTSGDALESLRARGVKILVDDFGSGYSSLGLLHALPVDGLKIDQTFVADLESSPSARAVVRAVSQMTRDLELRVVAEGIETREQLGRLRELGCQLGQGFLFSKPVPPEEARALLGQTLL